MARKVLLALGVLGLLGAAEYLRCRYSNPPLAVRSAAISGPASNAVAALGKPARRTTIDRAELLERGVGGFAIHSEDLKATASSSFDVLLWKRTCFFCRTRQLLVVADAISGQVVHFDARATGWAPPIIVLEEGGVR